METKAAEKVGGSCCALYNHQEQKVSEMYKTTVCATYNEVLWDFYERASIFSCFLNI